MCTVFLYAQNYSYLGVEELSHLEMIGTIVYQLTRNLSLEEIKKSGFDTYFVDHTTGVYPTAASGFPWSAASMQSKGDIITDLHEDLAADATTAKKQPPFRKAQKPLILLAFRHFEAFRKNGIPTITQEQLDPKLH